MKVIEKLGDKAFRFVMARLEKNKPVQTGVTGDKNLDELAKTIQEQTVAITNLEWKLNDVERVLRQIQADIGNTENK